MYYLAEPLQGQSLSVSFRSMMCPALQLLTEPFGLAWLRLVPASRDLVHSPGEADVRDIRDCGLLMNADCSCVRPAALCGHREDGDVAWSAFAELDDSLTDISY